MDPDEELAKISMARRLVRRLFRDGAIDELTADRALTELENRREQLIAEIDENDLTGEVTLQLSEEQVLQLASAVARLRQHNVGSAAALGIIHEIFELIELA